MRHDMRTRGSPVEGILQDHAELVDDGHDEREAGLLYRPVVLDLADGHSYKTPPTLFP